MSPERNSPILFVEDNPEDYEASIRGFKKTGMVDPIIHCEDGEQALDYLFYRGRYADPEMSPRPAIVLLDLNLPGTDGREVLKEIKNAEELKHIPVIVLTMSMDERDIEQCYKDGANSYIHKPVDLDGLMRAIQILKHYWFEIVVLPKGQGTTQ